MVNMQQFEPAQNNELYVCDMQPFDVDDPVYGVIVTRDGLEWHHTIEFEYCNNPKLAVS